MIWLLVGICVLVLIVAIYYSIPFFKKLFNNNSNPSKKADKANQRALKKQEKLEKKRIKKEQKENKKTENINESSTVFTAQDEDFSDNEHAIDLKDEDPDLRVDYKNFDYDGFFEPSDNNKFNDVSDNDESSMLEDNINDLFEEYFNEVPKPNRNNSYSKSEPVSFLSDGSVDGDDSEIKDFLEELNRVGLNGEKSLSDDFNSLSPEMKALMISNFLDRKE